VRLERLLIHKFSYRPFALRLAGLRRDHRVAEAPIVEGEKYLPGVAFASPERQGGGLLIQL